jgi:hypothetical protein
MDAPIKSRPRPKADAPRKLPIGRRGWRVDEWCTAHSTSRAKAYAMMRAGELRYVILGGRRFIPTEAAEELLQAPSRTSTG